MTTRMFSTSILAALLATATMGSWPASALGCGPDIIPTTVQELRDCVPPPPPPPSKCDLMPDNLETELRASGKIDDDCNLNPPTCQNTVPPSGPVSCNPDPKKTCREVVADSVNDPDPCNPPSCETVAGNTGAAKPEACTPPTCLEAGSDSGMDAQVVEAACDTIEPPICEEIGQYFTAIEHNDSVPGRDEDCLPTLCVDLEEPTACLPGCENLRDIVGGVGHLLLDADCQPRKPLCEEVAPYTPVQPDFWIDCVPWGLPPACEEVVATANELGEDYLPFPMNCQADIPIDLPLCPGGASPALAITPVMNGNGAGTWWQLYQEPFDATGTGPLYAAVYASWGLFTNNIANGADDWVFGWELTDPDRPQHPVTGDVEKRGATCQYLGTMPGSFDYFIDAGAGGWLGDSSCSVSFSWEVTAGIEISMTGGGTATTSLGGSVTCADGIQYDSESLIRDIGTV